MQGAVAGSPGTAPTNWTLTATNGLASQIVAVGTDSGMDYVDFRVYGTAAVSSGYYNSLDTATGIAASNGQTYTVSMYSKLIAGSFSGINSSSLSFCTRDSGGTSLTAAVVTQSLTGMTSSWARYSGVGTITDSGTAYVQPRFSLIYTSGAVIDLTIRIAWPQLELGAFATSPIRTTSAAVTRNADVVTLASPPTFGAAASGLFYGSSLIAAADHILFAFNPGTYYPRIETGGLIRTAVGATGWNTANVITVNTPFKFAMGIANGDGAAVLNGGTVATAAPTQPAVSGVQLGGSTASPTQILDGTISRLAIWPTTRLSSAELQRLTQ
jgi:hypothetical protein